MKTFWQFISEVTLPPKIEKRLKKFNSNLAEEPFNDLFGGKSRIVVPILTKKQKEFDDYLKSQGLENIDFSAGLGAKKNKQRIKIGKFLQSLKNSIATTWLDYYQKNKGKSNNQGVSVVISRNPIDILRMSDHSEWESCHSPGNSFWDCAIQEAKTGGAIAYVVRNSDLANVDINATEIFKDRDRNIDGIEPLERLRLRRFSDDKNEYLIPELSSYGIEHIGFKETVKNWALSTQSDRFKDVDFDEIKLHGGSYQDNDASDLWNNLLGTNFEGTKDSEEKGEANKLSLATAEAMVAQHPLEHYDIELNTERELNFIAGLSLSFPIELLIAKELPKLDLNKIQIFPQTIPISISISMEIRDIDVLFHLTAKPSADLTLATLGRLNFERYLDDLSNFDRIFRNKKETFKFILYENNVLKSNVFKETKNLTYDGIEWSRSMNYNNYVPKFHYSLKKLIGNMKDYPEDLVDMTSQGSVTVGDKKIRDLFYPHNIKSHVGISFEIDVKTAYKHKYALRHEKDFSFNEDNPIYLILEVLADDNLSDEMIAVDKEIPEILTRLENFAKMMLINFKKEKPAIELGKRKIEQYLKDSFMFTFPPRSEITVMNNGWYYDDETNKITMSVQELISKLSPYKELQKYQDLIRSNLGKQYPITNTIVDGKIGLYYLDKGYHPVQNLFPKTESFLGLYNRLFI